MKIEEVRTSFTVYVVASRLESLGGLTESLGLAGYMMATFNGLTAAFSELYSNPPHFVIFDAAEKGFDLKKAIRQVGSQLPESHVFLVAPLKDRDQVVHYLDAGVYDLIYTPLVSPTELVRTLDRAAERDYFMYLNERLMQNQEAEPQASEPAPGTSLYEMTVTEVKPAKSDDFHLSYAHQLFEYLTVDECLRVFLRHSSRALGDCGCIYFRYVANRRVLLAQHSEGLNGMELKGIGINFNDVAPGFRTAQLREPMSVSAFTAMVREVFSVRDFLAWPVEAMGELQGVICLLAPAPTPALGAMLREWLTLLNKALSLVECEKRLHVVSIKDLSTDVLNRNTFRTKVSEEISRSRRTRMPVSLVQIAIDQYGHVASTYGTEEAQLIMRTVARILDKHSRVNDIVGRTSPDEFGLLLPHTSKQGAMIKAERLRRIFETAAFERVLKDFPRLTVSVGVSEYPSLSRDAEELMQSADEALYQVRKAGNKVCVAQPVADFEPDFTVPGIASGKGG